MVAMADAIAAHAEAAFAFLEALVRAPSPVGHEQAAMEVFAAEAEALFARLRPVIPAVHVVPVPVIPVLPSVKSTVPVTYGAMVDRT